MAEETTTTTASTGLVDLKVTVDNHVHGGKPVAKGTTIKVPPQTKAMLEAAWKKQAEAGK